MESVYPKNILFEYYDRVSKPQDSDILGNFEVWIYGTDREAFPPHCHVRLKDGSFEFEVSLLNWEVINIKHSNSTNSWDSIDRDIKKAFFEWLERPSVQEPRLTNKLFLYNFWDGANAENPLEKWIDKKENIDEDLIDYLNPYQPIDHGKLMGDIQHKLFGIYSTDKDAKRRLHDLSPLELIKELGLDYNISERDKKTIDLIKTAEKIVFQYT